MRRLVISKRLAKLANLLSQIQPQTQQAVPQMSRQMPGAMQGQLPETSTVPANSQNTAAPQQPNAFLHQQQDEKIVAPEIAGNDQTTGPALENKKPLSQEDMPFQKCMPDIYKEEQHDKNVFGKLASGVTYFDLLNKKARYGKNNHRRKSFTRA